MTYSLPSNERVEGGRSLKLISLSRISSLARLRAEYVVREKEI